MDKKRFWIPVLICVVALVLFSAAAAWNSGTNEYTMQVTLEGDREIFLEYGQPYEELGAKAAFFGTHLHKEPEVVDVETSGEVDTAKVGTYTVRYTALYGDYVGTAYRRIHVVDTQAPTITLVADPEHYTLPTETYKEEGYSASDGYDGDLTDQVKRTATKEAVTYTVKDASGNMTSVTRQIVYDDPIPPELKLKGKDFVVVNAGNDYKEPGYTATDNCDGDITGRVKISGSVNTFKPGKYTLTYTVKDSYDNAVSTTRTVFVKEREVNKVNNTSNAKKVIYLTFDDGPGSETPRLLDILKKYNVRATFFVVNTRYISTIKRAAAEGHTIAIHTTTHNFKEIYASEDAYFKDLYKMQDIIKKYTGKTSTLIRFPGGSSNTISSFNSGIMTRLTCEVEEKGFQYFDWNVDSDDAGRTRTSYGVYSNVVSGIGSKKQAVVLMHDIKSYTIDAIERIIVWGLDNGYTFLPLSADSPTFHHSVNN